MKMRKYRESYNLDSPEVYCYRAKIVNQLGNLIRIDSPRHVVLKNYEGSLFDHLAFGWLDPGYDLDSFEMDGEPILLDGFLESKGQVYFITSKDNDLFLNNLVIERP